MDAKPHPEPYLTAACRLGVSPARCVIIEDSPSGVATAEAAGCSVLAMPSVPGAAFEAVPRRHVVPSLVDVTVQDLRSLVS